MGVELTAPSTAILSKVLKEGSTYYSSILDSKQKRYDPAEGVSIRSYGIYGGAIYLPSTCSIFIGAIKANSVVAVVIALKTLEEYELKDILKLLFPKHEWEAVAKAVMVFPKHERKGITNALNAIVNGILSFLSFFPEYIHQTMIAKLRDPYYFRHAQEIVLEEGVDKKPSVRLLGKKNPELQTGESMDAPGKQNLVLQTAAGDLVSRAGDPDSYTRNYEHVRVSDAPGYPYNMTRSIVSHYTQKEIESATARVEGSTTDRFTATTPGAHLFRQNHLQSLHASSMLKNSYGNGISDCMSHNKDDLENCSDAPGNLWNMSKDTTGIVDKCDSQRRIPSIIDKKKTDFHNKYKDEEDSEERQEGEHTFGNSSSGDTYPDQYGHFDSISQCRMDARHFASEQEPVLSEFRPGDLVSLVNNTTFPVDNRAPSYLNVHDHASRDAPDNHNLVSPLDLARDVHGEYNCQGELCSFKERKNNFDKAKEEGKDSDIHPANDYGKSAHYHTNNEHHHTVLPSKANLQPDTFKVPEHINSYTVNDSSHAGSRFDPTGHHTVLPPEANLQPDTLKVPEQINSCTVKNSAHASYRFLPTGLEEIHHIPGEGANQEISYSRLPAQLTKDDGDGHAPLPVSMEVIDSCERLGSTQMPTPQPNTPLTSQGMALPFKKICNTNKYTGVLDEYNNQGEAWGSKENKHKVEEEDRHWGNLSKNPVSNDSENLSDFDKDKEEEEDPFLVDLPRNPVCEHKEGFDKDKEEEKEPFSVDIPRNPVREHKEGFDKDKEEEDWLLTEIVKDEEEEDPGTSHLISNAATDSADSWKGDYALFHNNNGHHTELPPEANLHPDTLRVPEHFNSCTVKDSAHARYRFVPTVTVDDVPGDGANEGISCHWLSVKEDDEQAALPVSMEVIDRCRRLGSTHLPAIPPNAPLTLKAMPLPFMRIWNTNKYTGVLGEYNCQGGAARISKEKNSVFHEGEEDEQMLTCALKALDVQLIYQAFLYSCSRPPTLDLLC